MNPPDVLLAAMERDVQVAADRGRRAVFTGGRHVEIARLVEARALLALVVELGLVEASDPAWRRVGGPSRSGKKVAQEELSRAVIATNQEGVLGDAAVRARAGVHRLLHWHAVLRVRAFLHLNIRRRHA